MPPAVGAIGAAVAAVGGAISAAVGGITASSVIGFAIKSAISFGVSYLLKPKLNTPDPTHGTLPSFEAEATGRSQVLRSSIASRQLVYGEVAVSGPLVFAKVGGDKNEYLHLVIALAGHELESIGDVWFGDKLSTDYDQWRPKRVRVAMSDQGVAQYRIKIDGSLWLDYSLSGLASAIESGRSDLTVDVDGTQLVIEGASYSAEFEIDAALMILDDDSTLNGTWVTEKTAIQMWRITKHLGGASQTADADLVSEVSEWTTSHRLRGIAYLYVRLAHDTEVWVSGIPNIKAKVKGKQVYDPRTGLTAWSANWALCVRDYLSSTDGFGAESDEIDDDSVKVAANLADEWCSSASGITRRYECHGTVDLGTQPMNALDRLLSAGSGSLTYTDGRYSLHGGAWETPVAYLDEDDLRGDVSVRGATPRQELYNAVRGVYLDPDYWQPTDFPVQSSSTYEAEDGDQIYRDIELPYTKDVQIAQRLARIALKQSRQRIVVQLPAKIGAFRLNAFDTVYLTLEKFGWTEKTFRVIAWQLSQDFGVDLTLAEEEAGIWTYDSATAIVPSAAPALADSSTSEPDTPTALSTSQEWVAGAVQVTLSWTQVADPYATSTEIQYRDDDATLPTWIHAASAADVTAYTLVGLLETHRYSFRIRSVYSNGRTSDWASTSIWTLAHVAAGSYRITGRPVGLSKV